jgi:hypothetical protein
MNRFTGSLEIVITFLYHNYKIAVTKTQIIITLSNLQYRFHGNGFIAQEL